MEGLWTSIPDWSKAFTLMASAEPAAILSAEGSISSTKSSGEGIGLGTAVMLWVGVGSTVDVGVTIGGGTNLSVGAGVAEETVAGAVALSAIGAVGAAGWEVLVGDAAAKGWLAPSPVSPAPLVAA